MYSFLHILITLDCYYCLIIANHFKLSSKYRAHAYIKISLPVFSETKSFNNPTNLLHGIDHDILPEVLRLSTMANEDMKLPELDVVQIVIDGLISWKESLRLGRIPCNGSWPHDPLFSMLAEVVIRLDFSRLVSRHPELIPATVRCILELVLKYQVKLQDMKEKGNAMINSEESEVMDLEMMYHNPGEGSHVPVSFSFEERQREYEKDLAASLVKKFESEWSPALYGLSLLDGIFGSRHGLLSADSGNGNGGGSGGGYGLFDGVWSHKGWKQIDVVQDQVKKMPELKQLVSTLGRRPSMHGDDYRKYPPQIRDGKAPQGVAASSSVPDQVTGIRRSRSLEGLLPSESLLLALKSRGKIVDSDSKVSLTGEETTVLMSNSNDDLLHQTHTSNSSLTRRLRLLFTARYIESTLASYDRSGWEDTNARPRRQPWRHSQHLPTASGGPIIVCLDTSWSMVGPRELLAKSVVFECAVMAVKLKRSCYVLAFSGRGNVAECDVSLSGSKDGLVRLLDFLGNSFEGGTDVTSPLMRSFDMVENNPAWASADVLLVTDGELSNPPVSDAVMEQLRKLEAEKSLLVHGLLVGREESPQLASLCSDWDGENRVYNFLYKWDPISMMKADKETIDSTDISQDNFLRSRSSPKKGGKGSTKKRMMSALFATSTNVDGNIFIPSNPTNVNIPQQIINGALTQAEAIVATSLSAKVTYVVDRVFAEAVCGKLASAIGVLEKDLVERETESRLVLLAALCREHILLLGPPGTGKSALGRRLAAISRSRQGRGAFFERLLTKYTTPEELFGPLSLAALERDEYVRNTRGYLPDATVAFLDEIFKANSAILNSLLTILNERMFDNGNVRALVPLLAVVAASNELPESEELDALYDRFLLRVIVERVSTDGVAELLRLGRESDRSLGSNENIIGQNADGVLTEEFLNTILNFSTTVEVPADVISLLQDLRLYLQEEMSPAISCTDRRLVKAQKLLRVVAATHGHRAVNIFDCLVLRHVFWFVPDDFMKIDDWLWKRVVSPRSSDGLKFLAMNMMKTVVQRLEKADKFYTVSVRAQSDLKELQALLTTRSTETRLKVALFEDSKVTGNLGGNIWLSPDDVAVVKQRLVPTLIREAASLEDLLGCVLALQQALLIEDDESARIVLIREVWDTYTRSRSNILGLGESEIDGDSDSLEGIDDDSDFRRSKGRNKSNKKRNKSRVDDN